MRKRKLLTLTTLSFFALSACSNRYAIDDNLNSVGQSVINFVDGSFSAQIYNTDLKSVYDATLETINNDNNYQLKYKSINEDSAGIKGVINSINKPFKISLSKASNDTINVTISINPFGNKDISIAMFVAIKQNLGQ